nr:hypothetical protein [uncultured Campylobacter sp.]
MNANRSQIKFDSVMLRSAIFLSDKFDDKRSPPLRFLQVAIGVVSNLRCRLVHLAATVKFGFE